MLFTRFLPLAGSLALLTACHEQATQTADKPTIALIAPVPSGPQCYTWTTAKDTVRLTLTTTQPAVTGQLIYRYFEKDRNHGTISGAMHGDTLRAEYLFHSEGMTSMREVAFLRRGTGFVEGYGKMVERRGKQVFQAPHKLQFDSKDVLMPVACPR